MRTDTLTGKTPRTQRWDRRNHRLTCVCGLFLLAAVPVGSFSAPQGTPLVLAFSSFRDRPLHPRLYFYEHDGVSLGAPAGAVDAVNLRVDTHPSLALGGRLCAWSAEDENNEGKARVWDREAKAELRPLPGLNAEGAEIGTALSADGRWLALAGWRRPGSAGGWDVFLYDLAGKAGVTLALNTDDDEQAPALSGDGRLVAFVASRPGGAGLSDVYLYDRIEAKLLPLPGLNSKSRDAEPSLSADGRLVAFASDRAGGTGSRDIYLYDRQSGALLPLPGLNGPSIDQTPSLSPDGRYLAFVSERLAGEGERDVYLYDRDAGRLLPTPGLNTKAEDFDPAVTLAASPRN